MTHHKKEQAQRLHVAAHMDFQPCWLRIEYLNLSSMLEEALHSTPNLALKPASHCAYAAAAAQAQFDDRAKHQEYP